MTTAETRKRLAVGGAHGFEQVLGAFAVLLEIGRRRQIKFVRTGHDILLSSPGVRITDRKKDRLKRSHFSSGRSPFRGPEASCTQRHRNRRAGPQASAS